MSLFAPKDRPQSDLLHLELKQALQRELSLVREVLANLHQEELSLIFQDMGTYRQLIQSRLEMQDRLVHLKTVQDATTQQLFAILQEKKENLDLEQILPDNEPIRWEILSLRDQLATLMDKMNRQQMRNQHLADHPEHLLSVQHHTQLQNPSLRPKRQAVITTYQVKH